MARAMQQAFEGEVEAAKALLDSAQKEVTKRRDSRNRMRYILANAISLCVILFVVFVERGGLQAGGLTALFSGPAPAGGPPSGACPHRLGADEARSGRAIRRPARADRGHAERRRPGLPPFVLA